MVQGVGEHEQQFASRLRNAAIRCGDVFKEKDLITIYVGGLKPHARFAVSRTDRRTFQQIREHAQSLGDTFREQQRELGKLKSNFKPKEKTSRRASAFKRRFRRNEWYCRERDPGGFRRSILLQPLTDDAVFFGNTCVYQRT